MYIVESKKQTMGEFKSDIEIAQAAEMQHIKNIAASISIDEDDLEDKCSSKLKVH